MSTPAWLLGVIQPIKQPAYPQFPSHKIHHGVQSGRQKILINNDLVSRVPTVLKVPIEILQPNWNLQSVPIQGVVTFEMLIYLTSLFVP